MPNWLADPTECARQDRKGRCIVLAGRNEVMSRSTRVHRTEEGPAKRRSTVWSSGHMRVYREEHGPDRGKLRLNVSMNAAQSSSTPALTSQECVLASDLLRAAAVDAGGQACGGQTILEMLWEELDRVVDRLMTGGEAEDGRDPGRAEGVAYAIAVMQNPYLPSIENVREQAMARWEEDDAE